MCWTSNRWRRCSRSSRVSWPRSWPRSEISSIEHERARDVAIDDRVAEPEQRVLLDGRAELEDVLDGDLPLVAADSWSSVEIASRNDPPAPRAMSERAESGASIPSPSQTLRRTVTISCSRGRWNTNVWQRDRTVWITFESSVVQKTKTR